MNLDETDLLIIKYTLQRKKRTATDLAKEIFKPKDDYELRKKDNLIRERLKKLLNYKLLQRKIVNNISYWDVGKAIFSDIPIYVDKKKVKFLGVVIKVNERYIIHGISK